MTNTTKMWIVRAIFLVIFIVIFFYARYSVNNLGHIASIDDINQDSLKFDSVEWKKDDNPEDIRAYMLGDLKRNFLRKGINANRVIELLGEPHWKQQNAFYYRLGIFGGMEPSYLVIQFDNKGNLERKFIRDL